MREAVSISFDKAQLKSIDLHPLRADVGRSGVVRLAVREFLAKQESEKKNNVEEKEAKK